MYSKYELEKRLENVRAEQAELAEEAERIEKFLAQIEAEGE